MHVVGYVRYAVRAFVPKPLQCKNCKGYVHVSTDGQSILKNGVQKGNGVVGGDQYLDFLECPIRVKEIDVAKDRAVNLISYVEVIKTIKKTNDAGEDISSGRRYLLHSL